jgi:SAM-dependent methyltransferase
MVVDLQLLSIYRTLYTLLPTERGVILDVGGGEQPWRSLVSPHANYTMIDIPSGFSMRHKDCALFDGRQFPIRSDSCDVVISVEVLEHVQGLNGHLMEIARVLKPGGKLIATTPWSARLHFAPLDFQRLSPYGISSLLESSGLVLHSLSARGNFFSVVANKTLTYLLGPPEREIRSLILFLIFRPLTLILLTPFLAIAHVFALIGEFFNIHSNSDPLGWTFIAIKPVGD